MSEEDQRRSRFLKREGVPELIATLQAAVDRGIKWPNERSGYEKRLCASLGIRHDANRDRDATFGGLHLEIKKSKSHYWLNLVRYAYDDQLSGLDVITLFVYPNSAGNVGGIALVSEADLSARLGLSQEERELLHELDRRFGHLKRSGNRKEQTHGINAQAVLHRQDALIIAAVILQPKKS